MQKIIEKKDKINRRFHNITHNQCLSNFSFASLDNLNIKDFSDSNKFFIFMATIRNRFYH